MLETPKTFFTTYVKIERINIMDNQQIRLDHLSWLGGIIDGEGSITVDKRNSDCVAPQIMIVNTDSNLVSKVLEILDEHNISRYIQCRQYKDWKPTYRIYIAGFKRAQKFLTLIIPYLVSKQHRANLLLQFCNRRLMANKKPYSDADKFICRQIWKENGRGTNHWI